MYKNLNGLHHQHRARSYSCVNGVTQYRSRNLCGFVYHRSIHNHVDKYVITKHYYQLVPLSLVTYVHQMLKKKTTPSAARLLLYSYVQRNVSNIVDWLPLILVNLKFEFYIRHFDYCSVHVSTVISHVSQQFRFLVFFIVTQWVVSVQWNYFYKLEYLSLMVVQMYKNLNGLHHQHRARSYSCVNGVTQYRSRNLCGFVYHRSIHNHVDKYVITKHYYQLVPLSLVTEKFA
ncbi:hypothetical protein T02_9142 [Trichinella nativa]|uniref:Uncharacterized protein n=1 Tax=Trichinella nativa TaxID=6335 RepID=A0A0V1KL58_9BILA|nr:hypothetical protein T02_9142 [Trichinella nativa]